MRAAVDNLDAWVTKGTMPPASKHARLDDGTAVPSESLESVFQAFPEFGFPDHLRHVTRFDFGPNEGIPENLPPVTGNPYPALVSNVDADGNDLAGIRLPDVAVPLATITRTPEAPARHIRPWAPPCPSPSPNRSVKTLQTPVPRWRSATHPKMTT